MSSFHAWFTSRLSRRYSRSVRDADLRAELPVDRRGVRGRRSRRASDPAPSCSGRSGNGSVAGDRDVVEAGDLPLVAEQLAREDDGRDTALRARDELEREADEVGEPREHALALGHAERGAADEEGGVVAACELLGPARTSSSGVPAGKARDRPW